MKSKWRKVKNISRQRITSPCFALLSPVEDEEKVATGRIVLLVKIEDGNVLYFEQGDQQPKSLPTDAFNELFAGRLLRFSPPAGKKVEDEQKPFGFGSLLSHL